MKISDTAKNKIQELLIDFPANTYFTITVTGTVENGFNWSCMYDTTRYLSPNTKDAEVYLCVDPFIVTDYNSYPALFEKTFDYDDQTNEFIITKK
jgi:hypothetical protein